MVSCVFNLTRLSLSPKLWPLVDDAQLRVFLEETFPMLSRQALEALPAHVVPLLQQRNVRSFLLGSIEFADQDPCKTWQKWIGITTHQAHCLQHHALRQFFRQNGVLFSDERLAKMSALDLAVLLDKVKTGSCDFDAFCCMDLQQDRNSGHARPR